MLCFDELKKFFFALAVHFFVESVLKTKEKRHVTRDQCRT
ncbi:hypothetical protein SAMN06265374_1013 [Roseibium denhamense]|uniref:Uncharacterized protein n=1 Tax=Roseibium denhamense TaxID=76305 RepID=A0ABY1NGD8_9HYPH|nr:hypothetical protein SAMN06265374_1013 [Roseibium denhamense]